MPESYISTTVEGEENETLTFRRSDKADAMIEVTLNDETIHVCPAALLLAVKTITEEA